MQQLSIPKLAIKRLIEDRALLLSVFIGMIVAATLAAGATVYPRSLEQLAFNASIDRLASRFLSVDVFSSNIALTESSIEDAEGLIADAVERHIAPIYLGQEKYIKADTGLVGLPDRPVPDRWETGQLVSRGYLNHLSNLGAHSRFLQGRMAVSDVVDGPEGPTLEAVIPTATVQDFGLQVGDVVVLTPDVGAARMTARIVGVFEPADLTDEYWNDAAVFINPDVLGVPPMGPAPPPGVLVSGNESPVIVFVAQEAMIDAVSRTFSGTLVSPLWFMTVDKEGFKDWSMTETRFRLEGFTNEIIETMPGASVSTGVVLGLLDDLERRGFFARVPLLVLLAALMVTVLFFLSMMVSGLVQSRERDAGLLKTRGVGTLQLLRLYALEGMLMTTVAVALAPFLAMGTVAVAGKLPYFSDITDGDLLPIEIEPAPFLLALGIGLLNLLFFVVRGAFGARGGLLVHKLRSSRPPTIPFFHRYYLDIALLALGGLVFWELQSQGSLISSGLFDEEGVDETKVLAPVLFLVAVALLFMRFFPLLVRFFSGESAALVHFLVVATMVSLAPGLAFTDRNESDGVAWLVPASLVLAVGAVYWVTQRTRQPAIRWVGLVVQAGLVGWFLALEPPEAGRVLLAPTIGLALIVPAQLAFLMFRALTRASPAWLSVALWHMARNPLQFTWLVLLLVLTTGVVILSTTVGGTLDRSQRERILYELGADLRVTGVPEFFTGGAQGLKDRYLSEPSVAAVSLAFRGAGSLGAHNMQVLALETREVPGLSWYHRDDFSDRSLTAIIDSLQSVPLVDRIAIPEGAATIGVWVRPVDFYSNISLWMVVSDGTGAMTTLTLGDLGPPRWHPLEAVIPPKLEPPINLVSVQLFEHGSLQTPVQLVLDEIHVTMGADGSECINEECILEDFERSEPRWTAIPTSLISSDGISFSGIDAHHGENAAVFSGGRYNNRSVRGFYQSGIDGAVPVVISSSLAEATGFGVGDTITGTIAGRLTPMEVRETVSYFPTLGEKGGGFIIADLDNLLSYLNIFGHPTRLKSNELFIGRKPGATEALEPIRGERRFLFVDVRDTASQLESVRLDPLAFAGWRATVLISLGIAVLAAAFGYATYLLLFADRSRSESGFLQSIGLSRQQLLGLLGFEHLTILAVGLGLGTWAGFQMSRLMVSSLAVTESGERVLPPFILVTDWSLMVPAYLAMVAVSFGALFVLNRGMGHLNLQTIARASD